MKRNYKHYCNLCDDYARFKFHSIIIAVNDLPQSVDDIVYVCFVCLNRDLLFSITVEKVLTIKNRVRVLGFKYKELY